MQRENNHKRETFTFSRAGRKHGRSQLQLLLAQWEHLQCQVVQGQPLRLHQAKFKPLFLEASLKEFFSQDMNQFYSYMPEQSPTTWFSPIRDMEINVSLKVSIHIPCSMLYNGQDRNSNKTFLRMKNTAEYFCNQFLLGNAQWSWFRWFPQRSTRWSWCQYLGRWQVVRNENPNYILKTRVASSPF